MQNKYIEKASYDWSADSVRIINTPSATAKSTYFYVQEIGYFKTVPPYFTERSGLPSFLIVYTLSGEGVLLYGGEEYRLTKGTCFYIDCMNAHKYYTKPDSEWEFLWVHFYGASSIGYYNEFIGNGRCVVEMAQMHDFYKLLDVNVTKAPYHELKSSNIILNMLTELLLLNSAGQAGSHAVSDYVKGVSLYIDKHFNENISLDMLAELQHVSKYHLSREFKRFNGMTIQEYIINSRVTYAKELLKHSVKPVSEIAELCGVSNVSHFINIFKEREGMTPLAYRHMWK